MKTLKQLCVIRESIYDTSRLDTVLDLTDLIQGRIDASEFFKTNYVTDGMHTLLEQGFLRFAGKSSQSTFILTQAMGGGKTHNMLALGLLAQQPELRQEALGDEYAELGKVRVVAFTGRESDAPLGVWGAIADQLGKKEAFNPYYSPLSAPGQTAWVELLKGEPLLILLDELPPYFENARAKEIGNTDLATVTTTALSNLLVAVNRPELDNVCVVISDLRATYGEGSEQIGVALRNLENEVSRGALPLDPVQHNTPEIYHILRKRLFKDMPPEAEIREVARGYAQAVKDARQMDVTSASPEEFARRIQEAYPFHFSIRDLYSRFRENPGFQQTRDLIRLMRTVVAHMYESGRAERSYLIHPYDVNLNHKDTLVQISRINPKLENAISHDIASGGTSKAETIDANRDGHDAQDAGTLLLMASLSNVPGAVRGLTRSEVVSLLCAPGRDVSQLEKNVLRPYFTSAWYLHTDTAGRLLFKDVRNLSARLQTMADSYYGGPYPLRELREFLNDLFTPSIKDAYQRVQTLPALDDINVDADRVTLVITEPRPGGGLSPEVQAFYDDLDYQNRVLFLTGQKGSLEHLLEKAARLKAIRQILIEMKAEKVPEHDPQYTAALELQDEITLQLLSAARETFTTLLFPHFGGLRTADFVMNFTDNNYNGESQVRRTLESKGKFTTDVESETFRQKCEERLFTQKEMLWSEVQKRSAAYPTWPWHRPDALKRLKERLVYEEKWRESGSYVEKPPFPQPQTHVRVQETHRDLNSGEVRLRLTLVHGDTVYYEIGGEATEASSRVEDVRNFTTDALRVSFLCVDSQGEHETGASITWENKITIQSRVYQSGQDKMVELRAAPAAPIRYTTDGSSPLYTGGTYNGPFAVPQSTQVVLAIAQKDGITSEQHERRIDWEDDDKVAIDPTKPALWKRPHRPATTQEVYTFLDRLQALNVRARGLRVAVNGDQWVDLSFDGEITMDGASLKEAVEYLRSLLDSGEVSLDVDVLQFDSGQHLLDWVEQVKTELKPEEVEQV